MMMDALVGMFLKMAVKSPMTFKRRVHKGIGWEDCSKNWTPRGEKMIFPHSRHTHTPTHKCLWAYKYCEFFCHRTVDQFQDWKIQSYIKVAHQNYIKNFLVNFHIQSFFYHNMLQVGCMINSVVCEIFVIILAPFALIFTFCDSYSITHFYD